MALAGVALGPALDDSIHFPGHCCSPGESILIYLTVAGSVIPMRVLESDSIASVKLRIQTCKGFVVKKQKLVFAGRELARQDSLVKDYGVTGGNVLHLVLKLSDLLIIVVKTVGGKEFEFHVDRHRNVAYLKQRIARKGKGFVDLESQELFCNGEKLEDQRVIHDICKNEDAVIHLLVQKSAKVRAKPIEKNFELSVEAAESDDGAIGNVGNKPAKELQVVARDALHRDVLLEPIIVNPGVRFPSAVWDMINSSIQGLETGNSPIRSTEGTGGAYFMQDASGQKYISVFKPIDEEPNAVNNPQGLPVSLDGEGLKRGTRIGEGALREVAAYLLDHPRTGPRHMSGEVMGFAGVPPTVMVQCLHKGFNHPNGFEGTFKNVKVGSLQMFMKNFGSCEDMGPQAFPVEEVHKISVFDIRMANADRHSGNILINKGEEQGQIQLVPIDHGYCLPENFEDCTFDWLYWPQARQPFSPDTVDYIRSLDAKQDIAMLNFYGWDVPIECARTLRISTMLLKKGVERGLTPFVIGSIMCRETIHKESVIEGIIKEAKESLLPGASEEVFLEAVSAIMDSRLDELVN
ncbi:phosphatidylinositol 4-kinase gamma 4 [Punica granatum]|uniref:1-phosphatidylinositol 4-kinase n=2 Tax=Punica granatum TaxID=22663 RepID=A0A218WHW7_PUNGR|nr:phosphatidylinositol 4-kinase gamma 4 [Punica granatum]OWM72153.1 hypothetical protein CDL15_Pgr018036 [Punica granatum]PKI77903.1 hypothetical protein CRG98_001695 [Punica granatum]